MERRNIFVKRETDKEWGLGAKFYLNEQRWLHYVSFLTKQRRKEKPKTILEIF